MRLLAPISSPFSLEAFARAFPAVGFALCAFLSFAPLKGEDEIAASPPLPITVEKLSDEEAFLLRRITEFYRDGDHTEVRNQAKTFIENYPNSDRKAYLQSLIADTYHKEKNYEAALSYYQKIEDPAYIKSTAINKLQCYYELKQLRVLLEEARQWLETPLEEHAPRKQELLFLAAEALFQVALEEKETDLDRSSALAQEAKSYYDQIDHSHYATPKEFALAEIAFLTQNYEEAAKAFHALASKYPEEKEDLFFARLSARLHAIPIEPSTPFQLFIPLEASKQEKLSSISLSSTFKIKTI